MVHARFGIVLILVAISANYAFKFYDKNSENDQSSIISSVFASAWTTLSNLFGISGYFLLRRLWHLSDKFWMQSRSFPHLTASVNVYRDKFGIPYIFGNYDDDVFFAQGFMHGTERTWQLEQLRLVASGRLGYVVGDGALGLDVFARTLGMRRNAEVFLSEVPASNMSVWNSYAAGVNAGIKSLPFWPIEFYILRHFPKEDWTAVDSVSVFMFMELLMTCGRMAEISRAVLKHELPPELIPVFDIKYDSSIPAVNPETPDGGATIYSMNYQRKLQCDRNEFSHLNTGWANLCHEPEDSPPDDQPDAENEIVRSEKLIKAIEMWDMPAISNAAGSNAWAVSGEFTASGNPILAGDPHLDLSAPAFFFPLYLSSNEEANGGAEQLIGVSLPGVPGVIIGHNSHVAWSATMSFVDQEDFFVLKTNPGGTHYWFNDKLRPFELSHEFVFVKGQEKPNVWTVRICHLGPVISDVLLGLLKLVDDPTDKVVVLASTSLKAPFYSLLPSKFFRARSVFDVLKLAAELQGGSFSVVAADVKGQIGSILFGAQPVRDDVAHTFFRDASAINNVWRGTRNHCDLPHYINPPRKYVFTANGPLMNVTNQPFGSHFTNGHRALRIKDLLDQLIASKKPITIKDFQEMQLDSFFQAGCDLKQFINDHIIVSDSAINDQVNICADYDVSALHYMIITSIMSDWDCKMTKKSQAAVISLLLFQALSYNLFHYSGLSSTAHKAFMGDYYHKVYGNINELSSNWQTTIHRIINNKTLLASFYKHPNPQKHLFCNSLKLAHNYLVSRYSDDPNRWVWEETHNFTVPHAFCETTPFLRKIFCPKRWERSGGPGVSAFQAPLSFYNLSNPFDKSKLYAPFKQSVLRMVVDVGNWNESKWIVPAGVSGWVASEHYDDQMDDYVDGELHPMLWDPEDIYAAAESKMTLQASCA